MSAVTPTNRWFSALLAAGIAVLASLILSLPASAESGAPRAFIERETEEVTDLLAEEESKERARKFSDKAQEIIDFRMLASRALGGHWEKRNDEERETFLTLLQELLEANYKRKLEGQEIGEDYQIEYLEEKQREDRAFVKTRVKWGDKEKEQKPVSYKLVRQSGEWIIYDVVIDDISLEATYRDSYTKIIEEEGWEALIDKMEDKIEELKEKADAEESAEEDDDEESAGGE